MVSWFSLVLLSWLAAAAAGDLSVEVVASADQSKTSIIASGSEVDIISDLEEKIFNVNEDRLKDAVDVYFGRRPDDVYLHSPTPWGDLYKSYGWEQVTRNLEPTECSVLSLQSDRVLLRSQSFENDSHGRIVFEASLNTEVTNSVEHTWQTPGDFTIRNKMKYAYEIEIFEKDNVKFHYNSTFGKNETYTKSIVFGPSSPIKVDLKPGESVTAKLTAARSTMRTRCEYAARLAGQTAVNYSNTYKGHHFWAFSLPAVMQRSKIDNNLKSVETLNLVFYSNAKITIRNSTTHELIAENYF